MCVSLLLIRLDRRLALRQQQMDDRRRKQMNIEYSRGGAAPVSSTDQDD